MENNTYPGSYYQPLFDLMRNEHGTILTESLLTDIIDVVRKMLNAHTGPRWVKASEYKSEKTTFRPYRRKSVHEGVDYDFGEVFIEVSEDDGRIYLEVGDNNYQHQSNIIWANYEILEESAAPAAGMEEDAVEFVNWLHLYAMKVSWDTGKLTNHWVYQDKAYTTAELYDIFKKEGK